MSYFKKIIFLLLLASSTKANNVNVTNISMTGQNTVSGANSNANYTLVEFDLSWENSWRTSTAPNNWDAAWVFVKYQVAGGEWQQAKLHNSGHVAPAGSTIDVGLLDPASPYNSNSNAGMGVFVYRSANGSGTFNLSNVQLRWNYGINSVLDNDIIAIKVFAIEMVYVPQGSFYVGSVGSETGAFFTHPTTTNPYQINNENAIDVGTTNFYLNYPSGSTYGDAAGPIPAAFPKGFNAFYCMKYEITQKEYVDFLNTLTYSQQASRTANAPNATVGFAAMHSSTAYRNGIVLQSPGLATSVPAQYACNLNGNGVFNEADDGQWIACNYLSWADVAAFLQWSGQRPMTELEFEKACRGNSFPVANEYAWGNTTATHTLATGITNSGTASEGTSTAGANACFNGSTGGPMRVGAFAGAGSSRAQSGAGYYGAMNLSDNNWERSVTIGNTTGRAFTGVHGNGSLAANGVANALNWPNASATGAGFRGGGWNYSSGNLRVSDRDIAAYTVNNRGNNCGGRGVRTAP